jgi:hypothetical protein
LFSRPLCSIVSGVSTDHAGKIDVNALPVPDWGTVHSKTPYVAPMDAVEEVIHAVWQEVRLGCGTHSSVVCVPCTSCIKSYGSL